MSISNGDLTEQSVFGTAVVRTHTDEIRHTYTARATLIRSYDKPCLIKASFELKLFSISTSDLSYGRQPAEIWRGKPFIPWRGKPKLSLDNEIQRIIYGLVNDNQQGCWCRSKIQIVPRDDGYFDDNYFCESADLSMVRDTQREGQTWLIQICI